MPFAMSTTRIFTALLAAGAALANPVAKPEAEADAEADAFAGTVDLGPGIPTASGLKITGLSYYGDGCPDGSLVGEFCPETSSFNVSIKDLKAILADGEPSDDSSCHIEVSFKTESAIQINLLQGDFYGSVCLEEAGMTALAHSSVSFAGNDGGTNIPWLWYGPIDAKAVYEHNLLAVFVSQCSASGDFVMLIDLVLHVTRGSASADAVGFVDIDELTGSLSQAYVLQPSPCGKTVDSKPPKSESSHSGGSYGKEEAKKKKTEKKKKKKPESSGSGSGSGSGGSGSGSGGSGSGSSSGCEKCTYHPSASEEEEKKKLESMSEAEKKAYLESKQSYELQLKYEEEHRYSYESGKKPEVPPEIEYRTRLSEASPPESKSEDKSSDTSSSKCKRDANGDCVH